MIRTHIPEHTGYPLVGILPEVLRHSPYVAFNQITEAHGDFVKLKIGPKSVDL